MLKIEIRSRIVGATHPDEQPSNRLIELLTQTLTVRELITAAVEEHMQELLIHRRIDAEAAQRLLERHYSTTVGEANDAQPESQTKPVSGIKTSVHIRKALHAFTKGTYLILIDGQQMESLDDIVTLTPTSKVAFVRLTPLVGG